MDAEMTATGKLLYIFTFLLFFSPAEYAFPSEIIGDIWKVLTVIVGCCFILFLLSKDASSLLFWSFAFFFLSLNVISSLVMSSDGALSEIIYDTSKQIGFCAAAIYGLKYHSRECIRMFIIAGLIGCAFNYASYIVFYDVPGGMQAGSINSFGRETSQHWFFFGSDNASLEYSLPVAAALVYYTISYNTKWAIPTVIFFILTVQMYIRLESINATITMIYVIGCAVYALYKFKSKSKKIRSRNSLIFFAIAFNVIIVFALNSSFAANFFEDMFGKSGSFLARTRIWDHAIYYFQQSPVFGQGISSESTDILRLTYNHAHNMILQILYQGGLLSLVLFTVALSTCMRNRSRSRDVGGFVLACSIGAVFIGGTFEFHFSYVPQFFCMILYFFHNSSFANVSSGRNMMTTTSKNGNWQGHIK